jgi:four helix bundle protein
MASARSHRELLVWQKGMELVEAVYRITDRFPREEEYRLTSQLIRAVVSVPSNIAEGSGRGSLGDYARFVSIARGSLMEAETLLQLGHRLGYVTDHDLDSCGRSITELSKMLLTLKRRLKAP